MLKKIEAEHGVGLVMAGYALYELVMLFGAASVDGPLKALFILAFVGPLFLTMTKGL